MYYVLPTPQIWILEILILKKKILVFNNVKILDKSGPLPLSKKFYVPFNYL